MAEELDSDAKLDSVTTANSNANSNAPLLNANSNANLNEAGLALHELWKLPNEAPGELSVATLLATEERTSAYEQSKTVIDRIVTDGRAGNNIDHSQLVLKLSIAGAEVALLQFHPPSSTLFDSDLETELKTASTWEHCVKQYLIAELLDLIYLLNNSTPAFVADELRQNRQGDSNAARRRLNQVQMRNRNRNSGNHNANDHSGVQSDANLIDHDQVQAVCNCFCLFSLLFICVINFFSMISNYLIEFLRIIMKNVFVISFFLSLFVIAIFGNKSCLCTNTCTK